jgi:hypothetical protein
MCKKVLSKAEEPSRMMLAAQAILWYSGMKFFGTALAAGCLLRKGDENAWHRTI